MLVRLGRVWEAVDQGLELLEAPDDALALATALQQRGEPHAAIRIAEHGLTLEGPRGALAAWLSNLAMESGDRDLALRAAVIAFREVPSLTAYRAVQSLADEGWPDLRLDLLDHLRRTTGYIPEAQVDIFLHEGLIDDAIAAASKSGLYRVLERVMDAAIESRPDWGIQAAREQAEQIMDAGRSDAYHYAVQWLQRARAAYRVAGREADWQNYLDDLRTRHSRKYKLMGMLKAL